MRAFLLTGAALVGAGASLAYAQAPANPSQGQLAAPYGTGPAANNNNNAWGSANTPTGSKEAGLNSTMFPPNTDAVPKPGTIVIRLNGRGGGRAFRELHERRPGIGRQRDGERL